MDTKEKWEIAGDSYTGDLFIKTDSGRFIALVNKNYAQLIASAPDLYKACELALEFFVEYDTQNKVISGLSLQLNEALAKAVNNG